MAVAVARATLAHALVRGFAAARALDVIVANNDEMAIGAISAVEAAGKVPGKDILILSIDGGKEAVQAVVDGKIAAVVECNPRFGPKAFETMMRYANGETIPPVLISGNHARIDAWRHEEALKLTRARRPDLNAQIRSGKRGKPPNEA